MWFGSSVVITLPNHIILKFEFLYISCTSSSCFVCFIFLFGKGNTYQKGYSLPNLLLLLTKPNKLFTKINSSISYTNYQWRNLIVRFNKIRYKDFKTVTMSCKSRNFEDILTITFVFCFSSAYSNILRQQTWFGS